jgi:hypothetical protein
MPLPYVILVLGYTLLAALFMWSIIEIKGRWIVKFAMAPVILWFGLFLYYIPPQLSGYPSDQEIRQERVIVRFFTYNAPTKDKEGNIYVVVDSRFFEKNDIQSFLKMFKPSTYTDISGTEYLRLYRLPWDEDLVKNMTKAQKKKELIILKKQKKKEKGKGKDGGGLGKAKEGKKGNKKGSGDKVGDGDGEGGGGTGGSSKLGKGKAKYSVEALTPNEIFRKEE